MTQILLRSHCLLFTPAKGSLLCGATDFILLHSSSLTNKCFRLQVYRHPSPLPRVEHIQRLVREDCHLDSSLTSASSVMLNVQVFMIRENARGHNILLSDVFFLDHVGAALLKNLKGCVEGEGWLRLEEKFRLASGRRTFTVCAPVHLSTARRQSLLTHAVTMMVMVEIGQSPAADSSTTSSTSSSVTTTTTTTPISTTTTTTTACYPIDGESHPAAAALLETVA